MYSPGRRLCDLCQKNEIGGEDGEPFPLFFYPMTQQQRDNLALEFAASIQIPDQARSMLGDILPLAIPPHMRLEFCKPCVDSFMPMLDMLTGQAFDRTVDRMKRQAEKNAKRKVARPLLGYDED